MGGKERERGKLQKELQKVQKGQLDSGTPGDNGKRVEVFNPARCVQADAWKWVCKCVSVYARAHAPRSALSLARDTKLRKDSLARGELEVPLAETLRADCPFRAGSSPRWGLRNSGALWGRRRGPEGRAERPRGGVGLRLRTAPGREVGTEAPAGGDPPLEGVATANPVVLGNRAGLGGGSSRPSEAGCSLPAGKGHPAMRSGCDYSAGGRAGPSAAREAWRQGLPTARRFGGCWLWAVSLGSRRSVKSDGNQSISSNEKAGRFRSFSSRAFAPSHF